MFFHLFALLGILTVGLASASFRLDHSKDVSFVNPCKVSRSIQWKSSHFI